MINNDIKNDLDIFNLINLERNRQESHLELIASENYTSKAVMQAQGSILTNKYAEGYPGKRYYGGCEHVDKIEQLAIDRLNLLFGSAYSNVQPHSGSQANQAVFAALIKPGDRILGMDLNAGGHLTHGAKVNTSGKYYEAHTYGVDEHGYLNYNEIAEIAKKVQPKLIIAGASAYSRIIHWEKFSQIAKSVGAYLLTDVAHYSGLIAAGLYPNPIKFADAVTSTTHKTLRGPRGGIIMTNNEDLAKKFNSAIFPGIQGGPLEHVIAGKAVAFGEANTQQFKDYCSNVIKNAQKMTDVFQEHGFRVVSGGTDCHMFLVDLSSKNLTGAYAQELLEKAGITLNKNSIPNDKEKPHVTSGIRIGTPALTTRGFNEAECAQVAHLIIELLTNPEKLSKVQEKVHTLAHQHPVY